MAGSARRPARLAASAATAVAALTWFVLATALPSAAATGGATLPEPSVLWNGALHVVVGCSLPSGTCSGFVSVRAPGAAESEALVGGDYSVPAGMTRTFKFDPGGPETKQLEKLESVVVRLAPRPDGGEGAEATLRVVHRAAPGGGGSQGGGGGGQGGVPRRSHRHAREIEFLAGVEGGKDYWNGHLFERGHNRLARCVKRQRILIQRKSGSHWRTVGRTRTSAKLDGEFAAFFLKVLPEQAHRVFRAVAPKSRFRKEVCLRAVSKIVSGGTGFAPRT